IPGTLPTRLTTILSLLLPVSTFTALLMVMLSRLMPFTSTSLSPTSRPAASANKHTNRGVTHMCTLNSKCPICVLSYLWLHLFISTQNKFISPAALLSSTLLTKMLRPCSEPPRTLNPSLPSTLLSTVIVWRSSLSSPPTDI
uniref:Uncharacterized protein n=1 Tax=Amphilophus citrinellus TaxID=61819 RepID=A0A3Q0RR03_AMPCI